MKRGSLRSPIPAEIRDVLSGDPFMKNCVVTGDTDVEWHHAFTYKGRRVNELWSILPLKKSLHRSVSKHTAAICRMALRARIAHFGQREQFDKDYPKSDLFDGVQDAEGVV